MEDGGDSDSNDVGKITVAITIIGTSIQPPSQKAASGSRSSRDPRLISSQDKN